MLETIWCSMIGIYRHGFISYDGELSILRACKCIGWGRNFDLFSLMRSKWCRQQLYERLEYFYHAFNGKLSCWENNVCEVSHLKQPPCATLCTDIWQDRDEERAKILSTVLAAPSASMRRWCAYPFGDACTLLNAAYRQVWLEFHHNRGYDFN